MSSSYSSLLPLSPAEDMAAAAAVPSYQLSLDADEYSLLDALQADVDFCVSGGEKVGTNGGRESSEQTDVSVVPISPPAGHAIRDSRISNEDISSCRGSSGGGAGAGLPAPVGRGKKIAFRTRSDVDVLDDGYRWRKYGKKMVKNSPNPRNYYRCSSEGCRVKKRVEREPDDARFVITTYDGVHNHPAAQQLVQEGPPPIDSAREWESRTWREAPPGRWHGASKIVEPSIPHGARCST